MRGTSAAASARKLNNPSGLFSSDPCAREGKRVTRRGAHGWENPENMHSSSNSAHKSRDEVQAHAKKHQKYTPNTGVFGPKNRWRSLECCKHEMETFGRITDPRTELPGTSRLRSTEACSGAGATNDLATISYIHQMAFDDALLGQFSARSTTG